MSATQPTNSPLKDKVRRLYRELSPEGQDMLLEELRRQVLIDQLREQGGASHAKQ